MLVLLAGIVVIHIATVVMLFVSTIANVWVVSKNGNYSEGLWNSCDYGKCDGTLTYANQDALKSVQAFMILSIIFSVISLLVFVFQLFTMEKGNRFFLSGAIMLVCWACILIGVSIYTNQYGTLNEKYLDHHGYCFILAWICFCFSFIIVVLYFVLRKK
ncbi:epithelial membrane protein 1 [Macrotis lagotis]|uniref:epithelial membrane protein 1 n=1 Tax=Macrotis lagotis TaxID=92651 RepID=UPI003D693A11